MNDDGEMPEGWVRSLLTQVSELNPPKPPRDALAPGAPVTFVPMPAVDAEAGAITAPEVRAFATIRNGYTAFRDGDVIMAKITPCMENGKAAIARNLESGLGFGSTEFHVLRPTEAVSNAYIYYYIRQEVFRRDAEENMTGSVGQKRVPTAFLQAVELPLPPLAEQQRIVAKVEELLPQVNATRDRLRHTAALLKRFRQSVLAAACDGRLTADWRDVPSSNGDLPEGWREVTLNDQVAHLTSGSRDWARYYDEAGSGTFVMAQNIRPLSFDMSYRLAVAPPDGDRDRERSRVNEDDILITIVGANTGDVCRVPTPVEEHYVCQSVALVRLRERESARYIELYLNSPEHGQRQFQEWLYGAGRPHLSFDQLRSLLIPLPSPAEQEEIVRRVDALFALADAIESRVAAATARAERLTQSILAKAFRGELVPTEAELARREGRDYEPASALLERIKALTPSPSPRGRGAGQRAERGRSRRGR